MYTATVRKRSASTRLLLRPEANAATRSRLAFPVDVASAVSCARDMPTGARRVKRGRRTGVYRHGMYARSTTHRTSRPLNVTMVDPG